MSALLYEYMCPMFVPVAYVGQKKMSDPLQVEFCGFRDSNLDSLEEQVPLTTEPFLLPDSFFFFTIAFRKIVFSCL